MSATEGPRTGLSFCAIGICPVILIMGAGIVSFLVATKPQVSGFIDGNEVGIMMDGTIHVCNGDVPVSCDGEGSCSDDWQECPDAPLTSFICTDVANMLQRPREGFVMAACGFWIGLIPAVGAVAFPMLAVGKIALYATNLSATHHLILDGIRFLKFGLLLLGTIGAGLGLSAMDGTVTTHCDVFPTGSPLRAIQNQRSQAQSGVAPGHMDFSLKHMSLADAGLRERGRGWPIGAIVVGCLALLQTLFLALLQRLVATHKPDHHPAGNSDTFLESRLLAPPDAPSSPGAVAWNTEKRAPPSWRREGAGTSPPPPNAGSPAMGYDADDSLHRPPAHPLDALPPAPGSRDRPQPQRSMLLEEMASPAMQVKPASPTGRLNVREDASVLPASPYR